MADNKIIGRKEEQKILQSGLNTPEAELIALYGRRRVGKTYLIRTYYKEFIAFEFTGAQKASYKSQLENFRLALQSATKSDMPLANPATWLEAFSMLTTYMLNLPADKPAVFFFDEFPWIETPRSGFLKVFDHWWNTQASRLSHVKVVICGSAASWMIDKILNDKGGLHNRVTQTIRLMPFNLGETEAYLQSRGVVLEKYGLLQLYMAMGGIPHYLRNINAGESPAQIIDRLFFTKDGLLKNEFKNLYAALFTNAEQHEQVIRILAIKPGGLTRNEIIKACGFTTGGSTSNILNELQESGFITAYIPFQKNKNESIYKLSDEYSLFYLKFVEHSRDAGAGAWLRQYSTSAYTIWSGSAFETVCLKHELQIRRALGIEGVLTNACTWRHKAGKGKHGAQIDLLLDRRDHCINICEMKFSNALFVIEKKYAQELDRKIEVFRGETKTRSNLFLTMVTTYGTKVNEHYLGRVQAEVKMEDLFG